MEIKMQVLDVLECMNEIMNADSIAPDLLNLFTDGFVSVNDILQKNNIDIKCNEKLAEELYDVIEMYNSGCNSDIIDKTCLKLRSVFNEYYTDAMKKVRLNIIVYGINDFTVSITSFINKHVHILGYINDDAGHMHNKFKTFNVLSESYILNNDYDFIFISCNNSKNISERLLKKGVQYGKIIDFSYCLQLYLNEYKRIYFNDYYRSRLYTNIKKAKNDESYEVIISGLSYSLRGIVENKVKKKAIKVALPSQDLYYDYIIAKEILNYNKKIKYWIMGVSYYSLDWDLSLALQESSRILNVYYPVLKDTHHLKLPDNYSVPRGMESIDSSLDKRMNYIFINDIYTYYIEKVLGINLNPEYVEELWNKSAYLSTNIISIKEGDRHVFGKARAMQHNKLNYPATEIEYIGILKKYIELLEHYDIKPILVIFPATKYYYKNFSSEKINKFYSVIDEIGKHHRFQLIDMFKSDEFKIEDFVDWDHLNMDGAAKMTEKLNGIIEW